MGRIIQEDRKEAIRAAHAADPNALGPQLALHVIDNRVPVEAVSRLLAVAEPTIYRWMYGEAHPRDADKIEKIKRLLILLNRAQEAGDFPLEGTTAARMASLVTVLRKHKSTRS